ncbi:MAG TPA: hypothetical protein PKV73_04380 [Agriterribacter sp.]|nr:hypothetical protein [Chitinophagaceae bacterium]HRP31097.1 hypothetical protein [Agriterribacter sp.]
MRGGLLLLFLLIGYQGIAQKLDGQWRGTFNSANNDIVAGEGDTEYVLELYINGDKVSGYSYSYFNYPEKRYYVICRLEGHYDSGSKSVVVNEEERIKGNTPPTWGDCLQTHILTFLKQGDTEKLVGRWRGYKPNGCGAGSTELERKTLTRTKTPQSSASAPKKSSPPVAKNKSQQQLTPKPKTNTAPAQKPVPKKTPPIVKKPSATPENESGTQKPQIVVSDSKKGLPDISAPILPGYTNRSKNILKTIEIPSDETFKVDFYDNGEIDGDSISVFYNNKLLLSRQRLTDKPLSLTIKLDTTREENELVMYADNMGAIPPNTALMVVTVGNKRYEVYITSTDKSNGTIRFKRKE